MYLNSLYVIVHSCGYSLKLSCAIRRLIVKHQIDPLLSAKPGRLAEERPHEQ